jgi:hypothetical protein
MLLLGGLLMLVIGWQLQPNSLLDKYRQQEAYLSTFDPET